MAVTPVVVHHQYDDFFEQAVSTINCAKKVGVKDSDMAGTTTIDGLIANLKTAQARINPAHSPEVDALMFLVKQIAVIPNTTSPIFTSTKITNLLTLAANNAAVTDLLSIILAQAPSGFDATYQVGHFYGAMNLI